MDNPVLPHGFLLGLGKVPRYLLRRFLPTSVARRLRSVLTYDSRLAPYRPKLQAYLDASEQAASADSDYCLAMLRMYAHIVDKGLHRRDWEPGRSKAAYSSAACYLGLCDASEDPTYQWAKRVLSEYEQRSGVQGEHRPPEVAELPQLDSLSASQLMGHLKSRTSTRHFLEKPVGSALVHTIAQAALEAPSSCHRQTVKIYGSVDPESVETIAGCFHGFTGFSRFVPMVLVFCADIRPYKYPAELFTPTIDTALAVQNAVLMGSALGISMTLMNWIGKEESEKELRACLGIPQSEAIVVGAVGGYPAATAARPVRKPVSRTLVLR